MATRHSCRVFLSLRFCEASPEAQLLKTALEDAGIATFLCAVEEGNRIILEISENITSCELVIFFGTRTYGKQTPSAFSTFQELNYAMNDKKPIFLLKMCDEYAEPLARFYLTGDVMCTTWMPGTPMPPDLVAKIVRKLESITQHCPQPVKLPSTDSNPTSPLRPEFSSPNHGLVRPDPMSPDGAGPTPPAVTPTASGPVSPPILNLTQLDAMRKELRQISVTMRGHCTDQKLISFPAHTFSSAATLLLSQSTPLRAAGLAALASTITASSVTFALSDGTAMDSRAMLVSALKADPGCGEAWRELGLTLGPIETLLVNDQQVTCMMALTEAIRRGEHCAAVYVKLGFNMPSRDKTVLPDGRSLGSRELFLEALRYDSRCALAYNNLGLLLGPDESVKLPHGPAMKKRELFLDAIRFDPNFAAGYLNLGECLGKEDTVALCGQICGRRELLIEAIRCDPQSTRAYTNLAKITKPGETQTLIDGRKLSARELYLAALQYDANCAVAFNNLASLIGARDSIPVAVAGRPAVPMSRQQLYVEAIRCNPNYVVALYNLSNALGAADTVRLTDGRVMGKREALLEVLRCEPNHPKALQQLSLTRS